MTASGGANTHLALIRDIGGRKTDDFAGAGHDHGFRKVLPPLDVKSRQPCDQFGKAGKAGAGDVMQHDRRPILRFDIGEGLLELGLVLCSLYFLARKTFFPALGLLASIAGTALGIWGWML